MTLTFGRFKGQTLESTPSWYQDWLKKQDWFLKKFLKKSAAAEYASLSNSLKGWNGHSAKGQATYDRMFELEKQMDFEATGGWECTCGLDKYPEDKYCQGETCLHG